MPTESRSRPLTFPEILRLHVIFTASFCGSSKPLDCHCFPGVVHAGVPTFVGNPQTCWGDFCLAIGSAACSADGFEWSSRDRCADQRASARMPDRGLRISLVRTHQRIAGCPGGCYSAAG